MTYIQNNSFRSLMAGFLISAPALIFSQTAMLAEFKSLPAFHATAAESFTAAKVDTAGQHYSYRESSAPIKNYTQKIQNDNKPYEAIILAKGKAGMAPGMGAANDFSDLNSPETQAKLAKMSQEEKIKFAMEVRERMNSNKNLQTVNTINKPGPLTGLVLKLNTSSQALFAALPPFQSASMIVNYDKCNFHCGDQDKICYEKEQVCNRKVSKEYYDAEIARYTTFMKNIPPAFAAKKEAFEKDLKEFDSQSAKYSKEEIAVECSNVLSMLSRFALVLDDYEKKGATILIEAKNNPYCSKSF